MAQSTAAETAWISWLRVIAIAAVVTIHTVGGNAVVPDARETLTGQVAIVLDIAGIFAVPVFVMLSGATMLDPARYSTPGEFLRKRLTRLVPAIIFWHVWYFALITWVLNNPLPLDVVLRRTINGNLFTALYFFWIVLGLSVVAPVLIPFVRERGRSGALAAGSVAALMTSITVATAVFRGGGGSFVQTAFTWWIPYLGFFLLGYGLRGVILRGPRLVLATIAMLGCAALLSWQWRNPAAPALLNEIAPVSYYGLGVLIYSCLVYLTFQGLIQPDGPLRFATGERAVRWGRLLGDATLGVFALHLTVLLFLRRADVIGGAEPASTSGTAMLVRVAVVLVVTYAIILAGRQVPGLRRLL